MYKKAWGCHPKKGLLAMLTLDWYLELKFQECFHNSLNDKRGSLCLKCFCKLHGLCWISTFPLRVWNCGTYQAEGAYVSSPNTNFGYCAVTIYCWEKEMCPTWLYWEDLGRLFLVSSSFAPDSFSLCWFLLCPFPVTSHSYEYGCMLSAMNPPSEYQTWEWS